MSSWTLQRLWTPAKTSGLPAKIQPKRQTGIIIRQGEEMRRVLKAVASGTKISDLTTLGGEASVEEVKKAFEELQKKV